MQTRGHQAVFTPYFHLYAGSKEMYLIAIAWLYVAVMMAVVEATSSQGSLLGAFFTLLLYGLLPLSIVLYVVGTPARKRALRRRQHEEEAASSPQEQKQEQEQQL